MIGFAAFASALALIAAAPPVPPDARMLHEDGRFSAWLVDAPAPAIQIADTETGRVSSFAATEVFALRVSRLGRVAWIQSNLDGFEVHRADAAGRDKILDTGARIEPRSLTVRGAKLRWRDGTTIRAADFHGMRGDRPPLEDRHLRVVAGAGEPAGPGPIAWRYGIEVEDGLPVDRQAFARAVGRILTDERGWLGPGSHISLQRVDQPPFDFRVTLAKPRTVDRLCLPLRTGSRVSCENRGRSVINWLRWSAGSPYWTDRSRYRNYLINHEVGHSLGHGHRFCSSRGKRAPVMQQQTGPATPCTHAQWPKAFERRRSGEP